MNVQELINELQAVDDKSKKVMLAIYDTKHYDPTKYYNVNEVADYENLVRISNLDN